MEAIENPEEVEEPLPTQPTELRDILTTTISTTETDEESSLLPEKPSEVSTPVGAASVEIPLESAPVEAEEVAPTVSEITLVDTETPEQREKSSLLIDRDGQPLEFPEIVIEVEHPTQDDITTQKVPVEESVDFMPTTVEESPKEISATEFGSILVDELPTIDVAEVTKDDREEISEVLIAPEETPIDEPLKLEVLASFPTNAEELPLESFSAPTIEEQITDEKPTDIPTTVTTEATEQPQDVLTVPEQREMYPDETPEVTAPMTLSDALELPIDTLHAPSTEEILQEEKPDDVLVAPIREAEHLPYDILETTEKEEIQPQDFAEIKSITVIPYQASKLPSDELPQDTLSAPETQETNLESIPEVTATQTVSDVATRLPQESLTTPSTEEHLPEEHPEEITTEVRPGTADEIPKDAVDIVTIMQEDLETIPEVPVDDTELSIPVEYEVVETTASPVDDTPKEITAYQLGEILQEEIPDERKPREEMPVQDLPAVKEVVISPEQLSPIETTFETFPDDTPAVSEVTYVPFKPVEEDTRESSTIPLPQQRPSEDLSDDSPKAHRPESVIETVTVVETVEEFPEQQQPEEERSITEVSIQHEKPVDTTKIEFDAKKPKQKAETITETVTVVERVEEEHPEEERSRTELAFQHERPKGTTEIEFDVKESKPMPETISETVTIVETVEEEFPQEDQPDDERSITEVAIQHERPRDTSEVEFDVKEPRRKPETITETVTIVETVEEDYPHHGPDEDERSITEVAIQHEGPRDDDRPDKKPEMITETVTVVETLEEEFEKHPEDGDTPARTEFVIAPDKPQRDLTEVEFVTRRPKDEKKRVTMTMETEGTDEDFPEVSFQVRKPGTEESDVTLQRRPDEPREVSLVEFAPRFTKELVDQTVPLGGTTELTVEVTAAPQPDIQWFRNGVEIFPSDTKTIELVPVDEETFRSTLFIKDVTEDDDTEFSVTITNPKGSVTSYAEITVEGK